jgi:hypothetical protein
MEAVPVRGASRDGALPVFSVAVGPAVTTGPRADEQMGG